MRYMPIARVEAGMALGQDIYDGEGKLILGKHLVLNNDSCSSFCNSDFQEFTLMMNLRKI